MRQEDFSALEDWARDVMKDPEAQATLEKWAREVVLNPEIGREINSADYATVEDSEPSPPSVNDQIYRSELLSALATIPTPPEANNYKAEVYEMIHSLETTEPLVIYAVTSGMYSDYRVNALFTDRNQAVEYIKRHTTGKYMEPHYIEEYEVNQEKAARPLRMFHVAGDLTGGHIVVEETDKIDKRGPSGTNISVMNFGSPEAQIVKGIFKSTIFARNEEHALRIAYDQRARLAAQILIDGYHAKIEEEVVEGKEEEQ